MKANELMIGDWFQYADGNKKGTIVGIKCDPRYLEQEARLMLMDYNGKWHEKELDDTKPIPITPEILEQNGFLQNGVGSEELEELDADWTDDTYIWSEEKTVDDKTMVSVYIDYPKDECIFEAYTPKTHIDGIRIRYVHELQHALKLCQIEKEIQL